MDTANIYYMVLAVIYGLLIIGVWVAYCQHARKIEVLESEIKWETGRNKELGKVFDSNRKSVNASLNRLQYAQFLATSGKGDEAVDVLLGRISDDAVKKEVHHLDRAMVKGGIVPESWRMEGDKA